MFSLAQNNLNITCSIYSLTESFKDEEIIELWIFVRYKFMGRRKSLQSEEIPWAKKPSMQGEATYWDKGKVVTLAEIQKHATNCLEMKVGSYYKELRNLC